MRAYSRCRVLGAALAGVGPLACDEATPPLLEQRVRGLVVLDGPVSGATIELRAHPSEGPALATARTDAAGRFVLTLAVEPGRYHLTAEAPRGGPALAAWLPALDFGTTLDVRMDAFTTWAAALAAGAENGAADGPDAGPTEPVDFARTAVVSHLGFDPVAPAADDWRAPLLEDAFLALAARAAGAAGARPGALTPESLLGALLDDAQTDARMDGIGADGPLELAVSPGTYTLTAETLRGELALAVDDTLAASEWSDLEPRDVRALRARLRCSDSAVFPACRATPMKDATPPVVDWAEPAEGTPLMGVVTLRATARDAESGVQNLSVAWAAPVPEGAPALVDEDPAPDVLRVTFDTRALRQAAVTLEVRAVNRDGAEATEERTYAVDNLPGGVLRGSVFKGPAVGVEVAALPVYADGQAGAALAVAVTDPDGRFELALPEYTGPLLLRATGRPDGTSQYRNEASVDELLTWGPDARLETFVPAFEPQGPGRERTLSPLTDLAVARAWARRGESVSLEEAWDEATARLGEHFGVSAPETLRPTSPDEAAHTPPTDADRYLLALACLSRQARELAPSLRPDAPATFTPLDLVALYRADLSRDGVLDGRDGATPLGLPPNAFRGELARACALWLDDPEANRTGLGVEGVAATLAGEISGDTSALFDPDQPIAAFDEQGPVIDEPLLTSVEGYAGPEGLRGPVLVTLDARDEAGVAGLTVRLEPDAPGALSLLDAPAAGHAVYLLDTGHVPDGTQRLVVQATDSLGNASRRTREVRVDNTAPRLAVRVDGTEAVAGMVWPTRRAETTVTVSADEAVQVELSMDDIAQPRSAAAPGMPAVTEVVWHAEGASRIAVRAIDAVGNEAEFEAFTVIRDATAPVLEVEPTSFVDERSLNRWPMPADLAAAGLSRRTIDEATLAVDEGVEIARQVHRWSGAAEPANPVSLRFVGRDALSPPETLRAEWQRAPGPCFLLDDAQAPTRPLLTPPVEVAGADGRFALALDAGTFGFDPLSLADEAEARSCLVVTLADSAGNGVSRAFTFRTVRLAPVIDVLGVDPIDLRAPRLADVDALSASRLLGANGQSVTGVAAFRARNPYLDLPVAVEFRLPVPEIIVRREVVEAWDGPFLVGFTPPPCWRDYGPEVDLPDTWAFLIPEGAEWRCERMVDIPWTAVTLDAGFALGVGDAPYGPVGVQELRRGPQAVAVDFTIGVVPGALPGRLPQMLDPRPVPSLFGYGYATVVQGPGRIAGLELECPFPPCDAWFEATRGERLTGVETVLGGAAWQVVARYGRHVELVLDVAGPQDLAVRINPP